MSFTGMSGRRKRLWQEVPAVSAAGTDDLESHSIFQTPEVKEAGGVTALGLTGDAAAVIRETKERIFAA